MVTYLQMNVSNTYGLPATFYQKTQDYDEARGHVLVPTFVRYINECEDRSHQIDAMLLLNQLCTVDSNHLVEVADMALPLLKDRIETGTVIEQYCAVQLVVKLANRSDLSGLLIQAGIMAALTELFHIVMDHYKRLPSKVGGSQCFCKLDGKTAELADKVLVPGHNLPGRLRELYKVADRSNGIEMEVDLQSISPISISTGATAMKHLQSHMLHDMMESLVEVAGSAGAAERRQLIDEPHRGLTWIKRAFDFPVRLTIHLSYFVPLYAC